MLKRKSELWFGAFINRFALAVPPPALDAQLVLGTSETDHFSSIKPEQTRRRGALTGNEHPSATVPLKRHHRDNGRGRRVTLSAWRMRA